MEIKKGIAHIKCLCVIIGARAGSGNPRDSANTDPGVHRRLK